jgi:hypothetical protein
VESYGGGEFDDDLYVCTPPGRGIGFISAGVGKLLADGVPKVTLCIQMPMEYSNGDDAFWHCTGDDPDQWKVIVWRRHARPTGKLSTAVW